MDDPTSPVGHRDPGLDATISLDEVRDHTRRVAEALLEVAAPRRGELVVLGCSTSEILGHRIGRQSSETVGAAVLDGVLPVVRAAGLYLAVQGCEHINRALVVEREAMERHNLEEVSVVPALHAGGAAALAAYRMAGAPVMVEHVTAAAGIDIGDTSVGMHVRFVQVPHRPPLREIGLAHVSCLRSRPKLIGGERARYRLD